MEQINNQEAELLFQAQSLLNSENKRNTSPEKGSWGRNPNEQYQSPEWGKSSSKQSRRTINDEPIGDVGSTMEEGEEYKHPGLSLVKIDQFKQLSEEEKSSSTQGRGTHELANSVPTTLNVVQIKEMKSSWVKASYDNVVKRIFDPPRNIDELKVVLCTRFTDLRPLLELDQTTAIKLEFRT